MSASMPSTPSRPIAHRLRSRQPPGDPGKGGEPEIEVDDRTHVQPRNVDKSLSSKHNAPVTVYRSLRHCVPRLENYGSETISLSASSGSTKDKAAPKVLLHQSRRPLFQYYLDNKAIVAQNAACKKLMPQTETSHRMNSEAAMSDPVRMYLLHPVVLALQAMLTQGKVLCIPQDTSNPNSRTDFSICWNDGHSKEMHYVAVLELKKRGAIKADHFEDAWLTVQDTQQQLARKVRSASTEMHATHLKSNAVWIAKQARKYADNTKNPCVAAFDWNTMVFFDFPDFRRMDRTDSQGKYVLDNFTKAIWFTESQRSADKEMTFRSMLFSFLLYSLQQNPPRGRTGILNVLKIPGPVPRMPKVYHAGYRKECKNSHDYQKVLGTTKPR